ncbi:MAG TPA: BON domain-containing protein [Burkholderiaceae bacterium]|nr:BON domain-containing protein [Burkholderiaceae bacterium]HMX12026.1 BON domain-containing protein [Burkholderiaceae bacterium]HMZ00716.1 BON domain-containing protein [Burkholderiaceae bacterium]HNB47391.1 BON domain-containing protein [Burkholderiaceae bacterium]HNG81905.1 BON domain-containing protein [Burkholderiaceae bacterium]
MPKTTNLLPRRARAATLVLGLSLGALMLPGCAPLIVGGAALGGALVATDRRSSGVQIDDQTLEVKAGNRIRDAVGDRVRVKVTSYNRLLLLTGEVHKEEDKAAVEAAVAKLDNVKVINELVVDWPRTSSEQNNDLLLSSKVKTRFIDTRGMDSNAFTIVTNRAAVYLMGRVTEEEAAIAVEVARAVPGVKKVVRVFEIITPEQLAAIKGK